MNAPGRLKGESIRDYARRCGVFDQCFYADGQRRSGISDHDVVMYAQTSRHNEALEALNAMVPGSGGPFFSGARL